MKITKKIFAVLLSAIMVLSVMPITVYAEGPSTKKTASSVAAVSSYYIYDLFSGDKCYYFDDLQEAFDYLNEDAYNLCTVTLLKDVELEQAITFQDLSEGCFGEKDQQYKIYFELDGHTVTAPNGNAFEFVDMWVNIFVNAFKQSYDGGNGIDGYGAIYAKDYAFDLNESMNLVISGGTYSSETKDVPFYVDDAYDGICNIRQSAIIKSDNLVYDNGYFGTAGNVFLRYTGDDAETGDHFGYYHVVDGTVDEQDAYIVEDHDYIDTTTIAEDRQSATIDRLCSVCEKTTKSQVAKALIGDKGYLSFASAAVTGVADGETATIELLDDDALKTSFNVNNGKNVTVELNNHTLTHPMGYFVIEDGSLTIQNGTIDSSSNMTVIMKGSIDPTAEDYSVLNIDNAVIKNTYEPSGLAVFLDNPLTNWGPPTRNYGIKVDINESEISADGYAFSNNGNYEYVEGAKVIDVSIANSQLTSNSATAMYIAGYANMELTDSVFCGEISGSEFRAGVININGDGNEFYANESLEPSSTANGSGTTVEGAAIAISKHLISSSILHNKKNYSNPLVVNIQGGKFTGPNAMTEVYTLSNEKYKEGLEVNISGGKFVDTSEKTNDAVSADTRTKFMTGGTYSTKPENDYVADKYKAIYDGAEEDTWTIKPAIVLFNSGDVDSVEQYHEIFTHNEIDENDQKVVPFTSIPQLNVPDGDIFTGWTYEEGNFDTVFHMDDTINTEVETNIYANWSPVETVEKDEKDEKIVPNNEYRSFGLAGVQIREDGTREKVTEEVYGGLRFIASFSEDLLASLNVGTLQVLEYGFVVSTKDNADINAAGNANYKIRSGDEGVKRINCMKDKDHRRFTDYRLFTFVVDYAGNEGLKDVELVARAYIAYRDANGVARIFYNDYDGTNVYGGCSTSYNKVATM